MEPQRQDIQKLTAALNRLSKAFEQLTPHIREVAEAAKRLQAVLPQEESSAQEGDHLHRPGREGAD